jgi:hypothetical protein
MTRASVLLGDDSPACPRRAKAAVAFIRAQRAAIAHANAIAYSVSQTAMSPADGTRP